MTSETPAPPDPPIPAPKGAAIPLPREAPRPARAFRGELTRGRPLWTLLKFGTPLVIGMILHAAFNVVDIYVVSYLNTAAVNAATYGGLLTAIPAIIANGVATATVALVARHLGRGDRAAAAEVARQSMFLVAILSVVFSAGGAVFARPLVVFAGADGADEVARAVSYMAITSAGLWTVFLLSQATAILRGSGNGVWPMVLLGGANLLNVLLDFVLVFGCPVGDRRCPDAVEPLLDALGRLVHVDPMGVAGAAWATVATRFLGAAAGCAVLLARRMRSPVPLAGFRPSLPAAWRLLRIGLPNSAQFIVRALAILLLMKAVSPLGAPVRAAVSIGIRYDMLALFFAMGWGVAAASIVGQCIGAGKAGRAMQTVRIAMALDVGAMAGVALLYAFSARSLAEFFPIADAEGIHRQVVRETILYLRWMAASYPFLAVAVVVSHAMSGAGETRIPFGLDAVGLLLVQIPACFVLARGHEALPRDVIWATVVAVQAVLAGVYLVALRRTAWMHASLE